MAFIETPIPGLLVFEPKVWEDERGYFYEAFNAKTFLAAGIEVNFVQDNQARSAYGVVRGLHYQSGAYAQAKLVRVLEGEVMDIALDIRRGSPTFGQWFGIRLSAANRRQLFVPRGFAHGYAVLSPYAEFFYKCDNYYSRAHEGGIYYDDPMLNIDWGLAREEVRCSDKDRNLPLFSLFADASQQV